MIETDGMKFRMPFKKATQKQINYAIDLYKKKCGIIKDEYKLRDKLSSLKVIQIHKTIIQLQKI